MELLPYIDEHDQRVDAPADVVWTALLKVLRREMGGTAPIARMLGCDPAKGTAEFAGRPGEAVPGFRVVEAEPGRRLALRGRHRFSNYALTFVPGVFTITPPPFTRYTINLLYDPTKLRQSGSNVPIKIQLFNGSTNVSSGGFGQAGLLNFTNLPTNNYSSARVIELRANISF